MTPAFHRVGPEVAVLARRRETCPHESWRVRVTGEDVRSAFDTWWAARCAGASAERVDELWEDLLRLARARFAQGPAAGDDRPGDRRPGTPTGHRPADGA